MKPLYKSIVINSFIYYVLIIIAGIFNVTANHLTAIIFLIASTIIISINVINFYQNFSHKKKLAYKKCFLLGFVTGSISWGTIYLTIFLPSLVMNAIYNNSISINYYLFGILTFIVCLTLGGSILSFLSIVFSPIFTGNKLDIKYFASASIILFLSTIQLVGYGYFAIVPLYNALIIEKLCY